MEKLIEILKKDPDLKLVPFRLRAEANIVVCSKDENGKILTKVALEMYPEFFEGKYIEIDVKNDRNSANKTLEQIYNEQIDIPDYLFVHSAQLMAEKEFAKLCDFAKVMLEAEFYNKKPMKTTFFGSESLIERVRVHADDLLKRMSVIYISSNGEFAEAISK